MKKLILALTIIALLFGAVSCNGDVDEALFGTDYHYYEVQSDGSWLCTRQNCELSGKLLEGTDNAYITVLDAKGQPTDIIPLTAESVAKTIIGAGTVTKTGSDIKYENTSETAQEVVIRTNGGSLIVNDESEGTIYHYNKADSVNIIGCHTASYHENGEVSFLEVSKGHVVLEAGSDVSNLHVDKKYTNKETGTKDASTFDEVVISVASGVEIPAFSRDKVETIADEGTKVCTLDLAGEKNDVVLFQNGIYEQIKVENETDGARWVDTSNASQATKTAADQLANNISGSKGTDYTIDNDTRELTITNEENAKITDGGNASICEVSNYAELTQAIADKVAYIKFKNDITDVPNKNSVYMTCSTIIDGNGYKLTHDGGESNGNYAVVEIGADDISVKFLNLTILNPKYRGICNCYARVNMEVSNCTIDSWFNIVFRNDAPATGTAHAEDCTLVVNNSVLSLNQIYAGDTNGALCIQTSGYNHKITVKNTTFNTNATKPKAEGAILGGSDYRWSSDTKGSFMGNCEFVLENCTINLFGDNTWFYYFDCDEENDTNNVIAKNCKFTEMGGSALFKNPYAFNYPVTFDHCNFSMDISSVVETGGTHSTPLHFEKNSDGTWSSK